MQLGHGPQRTVGVDTLRFGDVRINTQSHGVVRQGREQALEPRAWAVLMTLMQHQGELVTHNALLDAVWGHRHVSPGVLSRCIAQVRSALGDNARKPRFIQTIHGEGYRFFAEPDDGASEGAGLPPAAPLPVPLARMVGRRALLRQLEHALSGQRMLTLVGPGGVGKSVLGLRLAHRWQHAGRGTVWLIDLAASEPRGGLVPAILSGFGLPPVDDRERLAHLVQGLRDTSGLVFLDNAETHAEALARFCERLLGSCPGLRLLVTSQVPLGVPGEQVVRVPALSLPPEGWQSQPDWERTLLHSEAIRLLLLRAREADAAFRPEGSALHALAAIGEYLGGNPLALELAAARLPMLGARTLQQRITRSPEVLRDHAGHRWPVHHRSLGEVYAWSLGLLTQQESTLLHALNALPSSWTLAEAERALAGEGENGDVPSRICGLAAKSMLERLPGGAVPRYRIPQALRRYLAERGAGPGIQ